MFNPNGFEGGAWGFPIEDSDYADGVVPAVKPQIRIADDDSSGRGQEIGEHVFIGPLGWIQTADQRCLASEGPLRGNDVAV